MYLPVFTIQYIEDFEEREEMRQLIYRMRNAVGDDRCRTVTRGHNCIFEVFINWDTEPKVKEVLAIYG